jgi:cellobiose phosphorylase
MMEKENLSTRSKQKKETTLEFFNGFGGFAENGTEYEILLEGNQKPPAPWIIVISY